MPMFWKRKVLLFKSESVVGTDAAPVVGTDAVLARNVTLKPLETVEENRDVALPYVGNQGQFIAGQYASIDFEVEMAGAGGAVDAVPKYGPIMKACAMSQTVNAGVSVVYAPVQPGAETTGTLYFYMGGRLHKMLSCLGDCTPTFAEGKTPFFKYTLTGLFVGPTDVALPTPTLTGFTKPVPVNLANTLATLHAFAGKLSALQFTTGNKVDYVNKPYVEAIRFTDRSSTGSITIEDDLVGSIDWWTKVKNATLAALAVTHGTAVGNVVVLGAPNVQVSKPNMGNSNNIATLALTLDLIPSAAGNDEWSITTR